MAIKETCIVANRIICCRGEFSTQMLLSGTSDAETYWLFVIQSDRTTFRVLHFGLLLQSNQKFSNTDSILSGLKCSDPKINYSDTNKVTILTFAILFL
jgi:hypothetical protein